MGSIPKDALLADLVRAAAFEARRPFRLPCLRKKAAELYDDAVASTNAKHAGLSDTQVGAAIRKRVLTSLKAWASNLESLPVGAGEPAAELMREALETFSANEWADMIARFEHRDLEILRSYMRKDPVPPGERTEKRNKIGMAVSVRGIQLSFRGTGLVRVSDAYWATVMRDTARYNNVTRVPRPPGVDSWDEESRPPAIARRLRVTRHIAEKMIERMTRTSFEKFAEEYGGNWLDYWLWSTDPKAYRRRHK